MTGYQIEIDYSDLASRQAAARLRAEIESKVQAGEQVKLNFHKVFSVSESYADELFGVLALRNGLSWLSENISIHGADAVVFRAIVSAIRQRLASEQAGAPEIALLAARKALQEKRSKV